MPLEPPVVVTERFRAPTADPAAIVTVAVICVLLTTVTLLTVTPAPVTPTVAPARKFVPVSVTPAAVPCAPLLGLIEVSVGGEAMTPNGIALLVPPLLVTETLYAPAVALDAMAKVAVICVALTTFTLLTVIPAPVTPTVAPETKFEPVNVT